MAPSLCLMRLLVFPLGALRQAALPIRVAVPPSSLPEDVWLEEDLPEDVACEAWRGW